MLPSPLAAPQPGWVRYSQSISIMLIRLAQQHTCGARASSTAAGPASAGVCGAAVPAPRGLRAARCSPLPALFSASAGTARHTMSRLASVGGAPGAQDLLHAGLAAAAGAVGNGRILVATRRKVSLRHRGGSPQGQECERAARQAGRYTAAMAGRRPRARRAGKRTTLSRGPAGPTLAAVLRGCRSPMKAPPRPRLAWPLVTVQVNS